MCRNPITVLVALAALAATGVRTASAQAPISDRPYRGLFAGGVGDVAQLLTASASAGGGYDDNILADARGGLGRGGLNPETATRGTLGSFHGLLAYSLNGERTTMNASVGTSSRYYPSVTPSFFAGYRASLGASRRLDDKTTLSARGGLTYLPFSLTGVFPTSFDADEDVNAVPDLDLAGSRDVYWGWRGSVRVNRAFSPRSSLTGSFTHQSSESQRSTTGLVHENSRATYRYSLASGLAVRLGYGYGRFRDAQTSNSGNGSQHLDGGLEFNRALSFSRHTTLSFGTGTTAVTQDRNTHYRASGSAMLKHDIGRTWRASAGYHRGLRYIESLNELVFSNSINAGVGGLITRRLQVSSSAWASVGDVGYSAHDRNFDTYAGVLSVLYALTRHASVGANYARFQYRFDPAVPLPAGTPRNIDRQSVRVLLHVWTPVFQRARRPDAAR